LHSGNNATAGRRASAGSCRSSRRAVRRPVSARRWSSDQRCRRSGCSGLSLL